jgi:hypothetical protein
MTTSTNDLAQTLAQVSDIEAKAAELERKLATERAKAEAVRLEAQRQRETALRSWATSTLQEMEAETSAVNAEIIRTQAAFRESAGLGVAEAYQDWLLYMQAVCRGWGVRYRQHRAQRVIGDSDRNKEPQVPTLDFAADFQQAIHQLVLNEIGAHEHAIRQEIEDVSAGVRG